MVHRGRQPLPFVQMPNTDHILRLPCNDCAQRQRGSKKGEGRRRRKDKRKIERRGEGYDGVGWKGGREECRRWEGKRIGGAYLSVH